LGSVQYIITNMLKAIHFLPFQIILEFEPKNKGRFRLKKLEEDEISSTYSSTIKKEEVSTKDWYLEWQISYYMEEKKKKNQEQEHGNEQKNIIPELCLNFPIELEGEKKKVYPYELTALLYHAFKYKLLQENSLQELFKWIESIEEKDLLENHLKPEICIEEQEKEKKIKDLNFLVAKVKLPFLVYRNTDGTWVEIIWQKQQYAYNFQPMVYFCIPRRVFSEGYKWVIDTNNVSTLINLTKIFAITSERHHSDIKKILQEVWNHVRSSK